MNEPAFYTVEEIAKTLQVTKVTIYRYIRAKKIKAYKIGKELRINRDDFTAFLESIRV